MTYPKNFRSNELTLNDNTFQKNTSNLSNSEINIKAIEEFELLKNEIESEGIKVTVFKDERDVDTPDAVFPNNWISFHKGDKAITYPMFAKNRRLERTNLAIECLNNNGENISIYKDYSKDINKYEFVLGKKFFQSELPKFNDKIITLIYNKSFKNNSSISFTYQNENHSKSYYFPYYYSSSPTATNPDPDIDGETYLWSNPKVTNSSILYNFELKNYSLLSGVDYVYQSYRSIDVLSEDGSILVQSIFDENKTKNMDELSFFMLNSYSSNKRCAFDLGIRFNYHSKYKIKISPSISAKNTIDDYIYRMNYSQNYRSPSLKELYYNFGDHPGGFPIIGNQNLKPSTSDYFSFSLESIKRLNNSLEIYYNHVTNMIANRFEELSTEDSSIVYRYHNYKSVDLYGLNVNLFFHPLKNISIKSVYSYTNANSKHRDVIDGISAHSINMQLKYNVIETVDFVISTKYNSDKMVDISLEDENNQRTEITLPPYYVFNASCIKNFKSGNYIKFGVKNIFNYIDSNSEAPDFLSSYEPGRRFFININFNLSKGIK